MLQTFKFLRFNLHITVLLIMLLVSYLNYKDYGISWDEPEQRDIGLTTYNYLKGEDVDLQSYRNRSYGVVIELPLIWAEKKFHLNKPEDIFRMRHLLLHLLFLLGVFIFYRLNYLLFGQKVLAFIAMLLLYFSPPVLGHSYINSKDIPLMVFTIFGLYSLLLFVIKPTKNKVVILAVLCGLALGIRITALLLVATVFLFFIQMYFIKKLQRKMIFHRLLLFIFVLVIVYYVVTPAMWLNPFTYLKDSFLRMANFPWKYETLYLGKLISAQKLPWHYTLVWIFVSLPLLHLALILTGYFATYYFVIRNPNKILSSIRMFFIALAADIPVFVILLLVLLGSTLYDAWRHIFFLYPFLLIIGVFGLKRVVEFAKRFKFLKSGSLLFIYFLIILISVKMSRLHPYEYISFNHIISHSEENIRQTMEMDYWGISYKEALENILQSDTSKQIYIRFANFPGEANLLMLSHKDRKRVLVTQGENWDYFISNFRQHPEDYNYGKIFYRINRLNSTINITYKKEKQN